MWGLATFGQEGVERTLEILRAELTLTMRQLGTPSVAKINRSAILRNGAHLSTPRATAVAPTPGK
jgi:isopentenyl diphosphate isomerase/L-lactate dehydrogenase-like FMN-dependent dehydrogenase